MSKAADTPEVSRFDCKVKCILFPKLLPTFLGFIMISLNYQIFPRVFFSVLYGLATSLNGRIILCIQNLKKKNVSGAFLKKIVCVA